MLSSASSKFDLLPTRPPTPPREISKAVDDAISFLDDSNEVERLLSKSRTAPELSPSSELQLVSASSGDVEDTSNATRKVGFSPHPIYYEQSDEVDSPNSHLDKQLPSSKSTKPLKSILKPAHLLQPPTPEDLESKLNSFSPEVPGSFAKMLQSVIHQLAGSARSSRLDAYLALNGVLKTYSNVPDLQAMAQKMDQFMQFLARDIAWKDTEGRLDANIITQALRLTYAIMGRRELAETLDDDFKTTLLDRSIFVLEQPDMPKAVIKPHMYILAQQRFRSVITANGRLDRLVTALKNIEERCSGNTVIGTRLVIYERLFQQGPALMLTRIRDWLEHIFHGMLSSVKDIRSKAIEACETAGQAFGQHSHASRALHELFETEVEEGQTYGDFFVTRLEEMMEDKEVGALVPQIWSSVILFIRSKRMPLERWSTFKLWLRLIQKCHNSSDITIREEALQAWNVLVFAVMPDASTSEPLMAMLKIPIISGIEKRGSDKFSQQLRKRSLWSYNNLLFYAFRPGLSEAEHDRAWDTFVDPVLSSMVKIEGRPQQTACRVIQGLINGDNGVWHADAAVERFNPEPEELPKLDPKWVRTRLGKILKLLEPAIRNGMWLTPDANSALDSLWTALMQSVADAGVQEVKTSNDLKEAIALSVGMFHRIWRGYGSVPSETDFGRWHRRYISLVETMVTSLGAGHFAEDILRHTKDDIVQVAPTPSHRHSKSEGEYQSPFIMLFRLLCQPPKRMPFSRDYNNAVEKILSEIASSKAGFLAKLEVLRRCSYVWSVENVKAKSDGTLELQGVVWVAIAEQVVTVLKARMISTDDQQSQSLGHGLRHAVDILSFSPSLTEPMPQPDSQTAKQFRTVQELYEAAHDLARSSAGDGGVVLALMEPFAKALIDCGADLPLVVKVKLVAQMLTKALWPRTRQSVEEARKALWGVGLAPHKSGAFDPFDHFYGLIIGSMISAYEALTDSNEDWSEDSNAWTPDLARRFFAELIAFLQRSPHSLLGSAVRKVQNGIALWIRDDARRTGGNEQISEIIQTTWRQIIQLLNTLPNKDSTFLKAFESLLVAGFTSPHKDIVNATILFWNHTIGGQQSLEYPPKLEKVLRARVVDAEISLPTFLDTNEESIPASLPQFFESQSQVPARQDLLQPNNAQSRGATHISASQPSPKSPWLASRRAAIGQQISMSSPAKRSAPRSASTTPKPRLRHDDSQIQFAPIDSSPLPTNGESQHLTEHQKEVQARQHQDAQLFPDLSSSPLAQSTALANPVNKRLDFTSSTKQQIDDEDPGTPNGLPNAHGLMSDDLPSSPTPSSSKDVGQGAMDVDEEDQFNDARQDPPSSPPRRNTEDEPYENSDPVDGAEIQDAEVELDTTTVGVADFATARRGLANLHEGTRGLRNNALAALQDQAETTNHGSDLPSDTQLPTLQLQFEAEAASAVITAVKNSDEDAPLHTANEEPENSPNQDVTRVKNSFIELDAADIEVESQSPSSSQRSQRGNRKRRRSKQSLTNTKRRKQDFSSARTSSQLSEASQLDDDDIGEEIVVASSQRSSSPIAYVGSPSQLEPDAVENPSQPEHNDGQTTDAAPPKKRGRGRPRRSESLTPIQPDALPSRKLTRKASNLSNTSMADDTVASSFVEGTPTKSLKRKRPSHAAVNDASQDPEEDDISSQATKKKSPVVLVSAKKTRRTTASQQHSDTDSNIEATPDLQLQAEQAAQADADSSAPATPDKRIERPVLTPKSILRRLKDVLTDVKGMLLGSQEEREFDDVLFEFRREVHEAGRRGRE